MTEVKYSREVFEGYTHRFTVKFRIRGSIPVLRVMDLYSNSSDPEKLLEMIEKNKTEMVICFKILHCSSKTEDDYLSFFINDFIKNI